MFCLTKLDEELASSGGSRDPLGLQLVWSHFGGLGKGTVQCRCSAGSVSLRPRT